MAKKQQEPTLGTNALTTVEQMLKDHQHLGRQWNGKRINKELKFKTEAENALKIVKASKQLQQCLPQSVYDCVMDVSKLGLTLNPQLQHAYLVPRWKKGVGTLCTLYTSWRGLRVAAAKWGNLLDMSAQCVYANEPFEIQLGLHPDVRHQVIPNAKSRGEFIGAYCIAYMKSGIVKVEYMDEDQIARARAVSTTDQSRSDNPWNKWPEEMARKTVVRRASKHWQGTAELAASLEVQHKYEGIGEAVQDDEPIEAVALIDEDDVTKLHAQATDAGMDGNKVLARVAKVMGVESIHELAAHRLPEAQEWVQKAVDFHNQREAANG